MHTNWREVKLSLFTGDTSFGTHTKERRAENQYIAIHLKKSKKKNLAHWIQKNGGRCKQRAEFKEVGEKYALEKIKSNWVH